MPTLHSAQTLSIEGPDAVAFAQTQFSSKVSELATGHWQFSAWLDPQGRVRALFHLARIDDNRLLLLLRGGDAATMADALRRFVFRSKVSIEALQTRVIATGSALPMQQVDATTELLSLGCGDYRMNIIDAENGDETWHATQLKNGWPWLPVNLLGELLPASLSLHRLHAVAIDKGCYPGQEIVARLHYRGGNKRHLCQLVLPGAAEPGERLCIDNRVVAQLLNTQTMDTGCNALVVLNDDVAALAREGNLPTFDGHPAIRLTHAWSA